MGIRIGHDEFLTFVEAAKTLPRKNGGRRWHAAAIYRWASQGVSGVVLETIHVGGQRYTSTGAIQRFLDDLTKRRGVPPSRAALGRSAAREAEIDRAQADVRRSLGQEPTSAEASTASRAR